MTLAGIPLWLAVIIFAAALSVLTGAHFLLRRYRRAIVPTLQFWSDAVKEHRQNSLLGRFRHVWTFLFLVTAVLLMTAALLRPVLPTSDGRQNRAVILFERSASMGLTDESDSRTRFQQARESCLNFLQGCPRPDGVTLVDVGSTVRVVTNPADKISDACLYLDKSSGSPEDTSHSMQQALALAETMVASGEQTNVVIFTDRTVNLSGRSEEFKACTSVVRVGVPVGNLALLPPQVTRVSGPWSRLEVPLACWGRDRCPGQLQLLENGTVLQEQDFEVAPNTIQCMSFRVETEKLNSLSIRADCPDELLRDNQRELPATSVICFYPSPQLPPALEAGLNARGTFRRVASADVADLIIHHAGDPSPGSIPRVVLVTQGAPLDDFTGIEASELLWPEPASRQDLGADWFAGSGVALDGLTDQAEILLLGTGQQPLAALEPHENSPILYLSSALFHPQATFWKQPQFPLILDALINRILFPRSRSAGLGADWGGELAYSNLYHSLTGESILPEQTFGVSLYRALLVLVLGICVLEMAWFYSGTIV